MGLWDVVFRVNPVEEHSSRRLLGGSRVVIRRVISRVPLKGSLGFRD